LVVCKTTCEVPKYKTFSNIPTTGFVCPRVQAALTNVEQDYHANRTFAQFPPLQDLGINVLFSGNARVGISAEWLDIAKTKS